MVRTHAGGKLSIAELNKEVVLVGWVQTIRDKGHLIWVDLRDRAGFVQIVFEKEHTSDLVWQKAKSLHREYVISVQGRVSRRQAPNPEMATGDIEVLAEELKVLNTADTPPFLIQDETDGAEALRMQYRYLDLRRRPLLDNMILRHQVMQHIRQYLSSNDFLEIETPMLIKSTPEGARDFVVPARRQSGHYYALPQSPQLLKQLLMVGGLERYFQITKCFRDEDFRADRQPEFTQIDAELSFASEETILNIFEQLMRSLFNTLKKIDLPPFQRMTYTEAVSTYGSDRPDLRWGMPILSMPWMKNGKFSLMDEATHILGICVQGGARCTRKQLDELKKILQAQYPTVHGPFYLAYVADGSYKSSVNKFYTMEELASIGEQVGLGSGDLLLWVAGNSREAHFALGTLRLAIAKQLALTPSRAYIPLWITDFPLFEWNEEAGRYHATHHPFTAPQVVGEEVLTSNPGKVLAQAYDLVINGTEIGGGSIRIHTRQMQEKVFELLGFNKETMEEQFGFFLRALQYGAPPHGGIAIGLDRLCVMLGGGDSIRDYIAFPKNNAGKDTMLEAPAPLPSDS